MDIQEVARRAKVSTATVSRVLNGSSKVREDTAKRVRRVIANLNYVPNNSARNLRIGRSELFGLVVSDIKNPFFPDLIDHFEELAAAQGINVIFTHTNYDDQRMASCMQRLIERNVDGIAVMTSEVNESALELANRSRIPVVLLNQPSLASKYTSVLVDYSRGYHEAVDHLRHLGHRDIAFLSGSTSFSSVRRRQEAFQSAVEKSGMQFRKECLVVGDLRVEGGRKAMADILQMKPKPTAVVATNDLMAVGALQAAQAAGLRVPEDLSIIGFDDIPIAAMMHPELTTIHLSRREIAANAFARLIYLRKKELSTLPDLPPRIYPRLVVRGSTAPPHGKGRRR
jgi:DNA-binding LacI/PurR family transcriptional regulator